MTYEEAIFLKGRVGEEIIEVNTIMKVTVVPSNQKDFKKYLTDCRNRNFTDEDSIRYSSDGKFRLYGIKKVGVDVLTHYIG